MAFLDSIVATNPQDSEDIRLGAGRIRDLADATKTTFAVQHYEDDGTHKLVIQTDGSDPAGVQDNNPWVNWQNGILDLRVRVAGTTRILTGIGGAGGSGGGGVGHSARVYRNAAQAIPTSTDTKVQFNAETWDLDSEFDSTVNYRFTPKQAGLYLVQATAHFATDSDGWRWAMIFKNGVEHSRGATMDGIATPLGASVSGVLDMNGTTDYIEIFVWQNGSSSLNLDSDAAGAKIYAAFSKLMN